MSASTLLGLDDQPAMMRGYGAVAAEVVHDVVESSDLPALRSLYCDPVDGRLVAMDSTARFFTGGLRQFQLFRDQDCRLSGTRIVDVDHVREVQDGGPTTAANGQGLGKQAHVIKDHPGWRVHALDPLVVGDGLDHLRAHSPDLRWTTPTGHTYAHAPPPALGHGSRPDPSSTAPDHTTSALERHLAHLLELAC